MQSIYPYAPNAILIGFISSFVGGLVWFYDFYEIKIPGVVHFFCITAGVIGKCISGKIWSYNWSFLPRCVLLVFTSILNACIRETDEGPTISDADFGLSGYLECLINSRFSNRNYHWTSSDFSRIIVFSFVKKTETKEVNYDVEESKLQGT